MSPKHLISSVLIVLGEILIIALLLHFGNFADNRILALNILVSSIIYALFFIRIIVPMVDFNDKAQRSIGSMGAGWFFNILYSIFAVLLMIYCNYINQIHFDAQIIFHGVLIFLLLLGFYYSFSSSEKVGVVYHEENNNRVGIDEIRKEFAHVMELINRVTIPATEKDRITLFNENLRYVSPTNSHEAKDKEKCLLIEIKSLRSTLTTDIADIDKIKSILDRCDFIYNQRKQVFSN